jgi:hypothetical protein
VAGRRLRADELTPALIAAADDVLWDKDAPIGTDVMIEVEGQKYIARFEEHFHEPGGPQHPWGAHKGVTLFTAEPLGGGVDRDR